VTHQQSANVHRGAGDEFVEPAEHVADGDEWTVGTADVLVAVQKPVDLVVCPDIPALQAEAVRVAGDQSQGGVYASASRDRGQRNVGRDQQILRRTLASRAGLGAIGHPAVELGSQLGVEPLGV
jgi:hypothetical protein